MKSKYDLRPVVDTFMLQIGAMTFDEVARNRESIDASVNHNIMSNRLMISLAAEYMPPLFTANAVLMPTQRQLDEFVKNTLQVDNRRISMQKKIVFQGKELHLGTSMLDLVGCGRLFVCFVHHNLFGHTSSVPYAKHTKQLHYF